MSDAMSDAQPAIESARRRHQLEGEHANLPPFITAYNGSRCDSAVGACSCGAWHTLAEYAEKLERLVEGK